MKLPKFGYPNTYLLAREMRDCGYTSCADAEARGAFVTSDDEVRAAIDEWLAEFRQESEAAS